MKPKTRFMKMYYKLPELARTELHIYHNEKPYSLAIICFEVRANTKLGEIFLKRLGFEEQ